MRMRDTFLKPMHPEGRRFVAIFAAITLILFLIWEPLGWIGVALVIGCLAIITLPLPSRLRRGVAAQPPGVA